MRRKRRICSAPFVNLVTKFGPPDTGTPGAGLSRDPSHSASCQASSSQLQAPVASTTDAPPEYHDYEAAVIRRNGIDIPDLKKVKLEVFACIPLPAEYSMPYPGIIIVHGPAVPPNPEDATSYVELWASFANGHVVPDGFRHLFQAIGMAFHPMPTTPCLGIVWCVKSPGHPLVPSTGMQSLHFWSLSPPLSRPSTSRAEGTAFGGCCLIVNLHDPSTIGVNCEVS
jgi:hypothetical protein